MGSVYAQDAATRLAEEQAALSQLRIQFVQKVAELDARVKTLEADLQTNEQAFNALKIRFVQEIASREDKIADLEAQLANLPSSSAESSATDLENLQARLADEQKALADLRVRFVQEIASREDKIAGLGAQLAESTATESTADSLTSLQTRLAEEQNALAQLRIRFVQEIANREDKIAALSQTPAPQNDTQMALLQNRLTEEQTALAQLRVKFVQEIANREAQIQELSGGQTDNSQALDKLKTRLAEEQEALAQLKIKLVQDVAAAQASSAGEGKVADLEAQIASLTAQLSDAQKQIGSLTTELSNAQNASQAQPATTPTTTASTTATSSSSYLVVKGDTLSSIALHFYGDSSLWGKIATANNIAIENANVLEPGTLLNIPAQ